MLSILAALAFSLVVIMVRGAASEWLEDYARGTPSPDNVARRHAQAAELDKQPRRPRHKRPKLAAISPARNGEQVITTDTGHIAYGIVDGAREWCDLFRAPTAEHWAIVAEALYHATWDERRAAVARGTEATREAQNQRQRALPLE